MTANETDICTECGGEIVVGDWPFCRGNPQAHQPARPGSAFFEPITIYRDKNGRIRIPGRSDGKIPKGWDRVEITTRRDADRVSREMSAKDQKEWSALRAREREFFEANSARNRAEIMKLREGADGFVREFIDIAIRNSDQSDMRAGRYDPGVHFGVLE